MSAGPSQRLRSLQLEGAERRVRHDLAQTADDPPRMRRSIVLGLAAVLFAATFAFRLAIEDPGALVGNFYAVPIALVAAELTRGPLSIARSRAGSRAAVQP